jgi:hypothetical protein
VRFTSTFGSVKAIRHIGIIVAGAALWYLVSRWVMARLPAELAWYHYPFALPIFFSLAFGEGGANMNIDAGQIAWVVESVLIGTLADLAFALGIKLKNRTRP